MADAAVVTSPARPGVLSGSGSDIVVAVVLGVLTTVGTWLLYDYFDPLRAGIEQWFQADVSRVWIVLTDRYSPLHERSRIHPLFSLLNSSFVYLLRFGLRLDRVAAVQLWLSLCAGIMIALVYATARVLRFVRIDAVLIAALVGISASMLFWAPVPETKTVGAISILACVIAAAVNERRPLPDWVLVSVAAISLTMTVTNFMAGLILLALTRTFRRALQLAVNAFFVVSVLQIAQNFVYWYTTGMAAFRSESRFLFDQSAGTPLNKLVVSVWHSMIVPVMQTPVEFDSRTPMLSVQTVLPASSGNPIEIAAVVLWTVVLIAGAMQLRQVAFRHTAWAVVGLTTLGQIVFHLVYGDQTFLYTLHFLPLLVLTAALVVKGPHPAWGRALLCAVLVACATSNARHVIEARQVLDTIVEDGIRDPNLPQGR